MDLHPSKAELLDATETNTPEEQSGFETYWPTPLFWYNIPQLLKISYLVDNQTACSILAIL